ncbi:hypothetical protein HQ584_02455 [Patescibacteria group bacterium]|nr:hypothetical protein [Patescibacteria group bacterium]
MSARKIVLLVFGIIVLLVSVGLLLSGGVLMWAERTIKDSEGFYSTKTVYLERNSHAIVTKPADIYLKGEWDRGWPFLGKCWDPSDFLTLKIESSNNDPSKQIFIGIAEISDLKAYLSDVEYDEITHFRIHRFELDYTNHPGSSEPAAPTSQTLWITSAHGAGTQILEWGIEPGSYSFVLMNEDGSTGLNLSVLVGVKIPPLLWVSGGLLVGGIVVLVIAALMVYLAVRRSKPSWKTPAKA